MAYRRECKLASCLIVADNVKERSFDMKKQIDTKICNWFGDICSHPIVVVQPSNAEDLITIVKDKTEYPSPVRAVGSNSSVTRCGVAESGTVVDMSEMNRIISIDEHTITVEAGALYVDVVQELKKKDLQLNINLDYGNISMGTAACTQTKDGSFYGQSGQLCSYAVGMQLITPNGKRLEVTEDQPELLHAMRTSFGLLGIAYEVTFRIEPLKPLAFYHETFALNAFIDRLPELKERDEAMMYYMFPFQDKITVEFRRYRESGKPEGNYAWTLRNLALRNIGPGSTRLISCYVPMKKLRNFLIDENLRLFRVLLNRLRSENSIAANQVIRFPEESGPASFTFSLWAFPENSFTDVLRSYFDFCKEYYHKHSYRIDLPSSGFRVNQDSNSLLSYSYDSPVMTIDPVSSGGPGWPEFMDEYNKFGSRHGGIPLFNHTPRLTAEQVKQAYGERFENFRNFQQKMDPQNRFLNNYFAEFFENYGLTP